MVTKTIRLEIDAYEKLKAAKKDNESFSSVVRRCVLPDPPKTGRVLLDFHRARTQFLAEEELQAVEKYKKNDGPPVNPWEEKS